jgi:heme/copper-type cytochrome/quinol oxidase subunit 2
MQRILSSLAFLLIASLAYAQETAPAVPTQEAAETRGDTMLIAFIAIACIVVAIVVYLFIRRGGRAKL